MNVRERLEAHAKACRDALVAGKIRPNLPSELADLRWADLRRANLSGADLSEADLSGAHLRCADLRGADLRWADLRWADLSGADLRWADLRGANLSGADLRGVTGIVELPIADPRNYRAVLVQQDGGEWRLFAGCRGPWTIEQARAHWCSHEYADDQLIARRYMHGLDWWDREAEDYLAAAAGKDGCEE